MASASMGSVFLCLLTSSSFRPSSVYRESLGHSLSSGRPFCPSHPGLPCYPGILGLRAGANSRRPSSGEGWMDYSLHHPSRGSSHRTKGGPEVPPPSSGRPRRGGAAPAFVGTSNSSLSAPRAFAPGTGTPRPPVLASRFPMRLSVWTASVEGTDKFYLRPFGSLAVMHVVDAVLDSFADLFRSHRYSPIEKLYSVILFTAGLSLKLKCVEELVTAIAAMHNIIRAGGEEVILTCQYRYCERG
jgi:hypothetical protein